MNLTTITVKEFCDKFIPDKVVEGLEEFKDFVLRHKTMREAWDKCPRADWLLWMFEKLGLAIGREKELTRLACCFIYITPVGGGKTMWDSLTDERSKKALEVAEAWIAGTATDKELKAASVQSFNAYCAAYMNAERDSHRAYLLVGGKSPCFLPSHSDFVYVVSQAYEHAVQTRILEYIYAHASHAFAYCGCTGKINWGEGILFPDGIFAYADSKIYPHIPFSAHAQLLQSNMVKEKLGNPFTEKLK